MRITRYHMLAREAVKNSLCVRCHKNNSAEGTLHCFGCLVYFRKRYILPEQPGTGKRTGRTAL